MTIKQARLLTIGNAVCYSGKVMGVVTGIKQNSALIQWADMTYALDVPHDQMELIEVVKPEKMKGRYDR